VPSEGGIARRLTVHEADDLYPVYSPDGNWIAFSSARHGNLDVFVMSAQGGEPRRLTYYSTDDNVTGFSPDGHQILFTTYRDWLRLRIFTVSVEGGEPHALSKEEGSEGTLSPDGKFLLFKYRHGNPFRKGYHGPANSNIWIRDLESDSLKQLTEYDGIDRNPMWSSDGKQIYFVSDRETGVNNIWQLDVSGGIPKRVTQFAHGNIFSPSMSSDGSRFVFIHQFKVFQSDLNGNVSEISIRTAADYRSDLVEKISFNSKTDEADISRDGKQAAFVHHGDIFGVSMEGGDATSLTRTPFRESNVRWSVDSESIYFLSDRSGHNGIYRLSSGESKEQRLFKARFFETEKVFQGDHPIRYFELAHNGESIVFFMESQGLFQLNTKTGDTRELIKSLFAEQVSFSPDDRWLTYSDIKQGWNQEIYILSLNTRQVWDVSRLPGDEYSPQFSQDGKRLVFIGFDEQWNSDIYAIWLTEEEEQKYRDDQEEENEKSEEKQSDTDSEKKEKGKNEEKTEDTPPAVQIDFDKIHERVKTLVETHGRDMMPLLSPDGKQLLFRSNALDKWAVYLYEEKEKKLEKILDMHIEGWRWDKDKSVVYYRNKKGQIGTLSPETGQTSPVTFKGEMEVDHRAEFKQMYREAWLKLKYWFYDPNLHGVDWEAVYDRYYPLVEHARSTREFHHAVRHMLGELNASHLGIWKSDESSKDETGCLGVRLGEFAQGMGYRVEDVIPDSPADRVTSMIKPGEYIRAVNRKILSPESTVASTLRNTIGKLTDIEIMEPGRKNKIRTVTLKPISFWNRQRLAYKQWVDQNRTWVETASKNRIGYVHIRSMSHRHLAKFKRTVFALNWDKEALIIDVRFNPGGHIHNELIRTLSGDSFGYSVPRGGEPFHQPGHVWRKPNALLINESSFSDAEVFPNAYQILKIGKVIGMPTFGGVIGTGGDKLLDGSWLRLPWIGWYTRDGRNMENSGAVPDILVNRHPTEIEMNKDSQLEKAVEVLLDQLDSAQSD